MLDCHYLKWLDHYTSFLLSSSPPPLTLPLNQFHHHETILPPSFSLTMPAPTIKNILTPKNSNHQRTPPSAPLTAKNVLVSRSYDTQHQTHSVSLKIDDILPYSSDFDHLHSVRPHPIPGGHGAPCPFITTFTFEEFRTFWNKERVAYQWSFTSEKNSRDFFNDRENKDKLLPVRSADEYSGKGRPPKYDWTVKHACRRGSHEKTLIINRDSVGVGCPVTIRFRKLIRQERVEVEYKWKHNHDTSMQSRVLIPQGPNELNWTKEKVSKGLDWKAVKGILRPSEESLQSVIVLIPCQVSTMLSSNN